LVQAQDGLGHDMGRAVAHDVERFGVLGGDQAHGRIALDARVQIHQAVIELHGDAVAGEALGDAGRKLQP
jgi:hypothetical protein